MDRRLLAAARLGGFVLLGALASAAATIALAFAPSPHPDAGRFATWPAPHCDPQRAGDPLSTYFIDDDGDVWGVRRHTTFGRDGLAINVLRDPRGHICRYYGEWPPTTARPIAQMLPIGLPTGAGRSPPFVVDLYGWPLRCAAVVRSLQDVPGGQRLYDDPDAFRFPGSEGAVGSRVGRFDIMRVVPGRMMAARFVANAVLIGLFLFAVVWSVGVMRAAIRTRRAQCVACGYPRGESGLCPECGSTSARSADSGGKGVRNLCKGS